MKVGYGKFSKASKAYSNLASKGVTIPLKYTQSLLDLFEYFETPLDSNEIKVCCEQGKVTCTSSYFLP